MLQPHILFLLVRSYGTLFLIAWDWVLLLRFEVRRLRSALHIKIVTALVFAEAAVNRIDSG